MAEITLYCLGDYNNGRLSPFTIDLDYVDSKDEYLQEVAKGLFEKSKGGNVRSYKCKDCDHVAIASNNKECVECGSGELEWNTTNEEWIVYDYEYIPSRYVGEYDLDSEYFEYKEALDNSRLGTKVFEAGTYLGIPLDKIESAYQGEHSNDEDFAESYVDETGMLEVVPENIAIYFDYVRYSIDLMMDFAEHKGYYFSRNY